ncbi:MAG: phage integrase N-terminal SAM-like domain-containing protein [Candidatus Roizmanbacteria bacterium]|nr:phage integrase N-terminal SAM-like domain-containing protein [Candidatus Roizmanbacteria bacterium]
MNTGNGCSWELAYTGLYSEIKTRHYSPKTLKTYTVWIRQFQAFTQSKDPQLLSPSDVKDFLSFLAVKRKVSASTQNQAFNALLFFYRHIIKKDFGEHKDIVRAKRKPFEHVIIFHQKDLDAGYTGTFMFDSLEKKYKNCAKELIWQWFFPAKTLTSVQGLG